MIFVDSSVWIDYFRGKRSRKADYLDGVLGLQTIVVGDLILAEVLQGFAEDRQFETALRLMSSVPVVDLGGGNCAIEAAQNYRSLRKMGITIRKTIDTMIATWCIRENMPLLHSDPDFDPFVDHLGLISVGDTPDIAS
jgi:predicted nucleic acid-binding protein